METLWLSDKLDLHRPITEQPHYSLLDCTIEKELVPLSEEYNTGILPWSPLAFGFLSGKYSRNKPFPEDSRFANGMNWANGIQLERAYDLIDLLKELAKAKECTVAQLALAWVMNQPSITAPIIGPRTIDQLEDNLGTLNIKFDTEEYKQIDEISSPKRSLLTWFPQ